MKTKYIISLNFGPLKHEINVKHAIPSVDFRLKIAGNRQVDVAPNIFGNTILEITDTTLIFEFNGKTEEYNYNDLTTIKLQYDLVRIE